ncbi:hypothetical protein A3712_07160 [Vibrio sp. HI00D65]|uniref:hypothetical protein n=1 Tax=Vibrio sp. HI00D65 TaxID=1822216 RepID=UPI0007B8624D|nr:hypothetical protein [Vibrio sp. HI00D65]KZX55652.1 hypothetical protein A3712_07160 [Vibrio sp. HI00D65]
MYRKWFAMVFLLTMVSACNGSGGSGDAGRSELISFEAKKVGKHIVIPEEQSSSSISPEHYQTLVVSLLSSYVDVNQDNNIFLTDLNPVNFSAPQGGLIQDYHHIGHSCFYVVDSNTKEDVANICGLLMKEFEKGKVNTVATIAKYQGRDYVFLTDGSAFRREDAKFVVQNTTDKVYDYTAKCESGLERNGQIKKYSITKGIEDTIAKCSNGEDYTELTISKASGGESQVFTHSDLPDGNVYLILTDGN